MSTEDREESLAAFTSVGGVLVVSRAVTGGARGLSEVTDLVLYDTPAVRAILLQVLGRFDRLGRVARLNVHVLVPADGVPSAEMEALRDWILGLR